MSYEKNPSHNHIPCLDWVVQRISQMKFMSVLNIPPINHGFQSKMDTIEKLTATIR
jgi:hypothetical protein